MLKFSQYIWIGMTLLAAMSLGLSGMYSGYLIAGTMLCLMPAIAGLWILSHPSEPSGAEAMMVLGWTLLATLAVAVSGGARSSAIILFAIGPLTALVFRNRRLAVESAVFAAIAYLGAASLGSFDLIPELGEPQATLGGVAGVMGFAQALALIWFAAGAREDRQAPMTAAPSAAPQPAQHTPTIDTKKALRERNAYFASLSHDLRSPFTAILGYAETFKMNLKGNLTDKQVDQAAIIHESAQDLLALVDDMMDMAKSEAGKLKLEPEPIHLGDLGKAIMQQMQAMADRKDVTLTIDTYGEPWAHADARLVRRIWQNLISNAIKYSNHGGTVQLSASERVRHAILSVKDDGRGMSEEDLARIAEPFAMGENASDKAGTGLGLVNVKRFAEMHGGKVVIDTAPGEGARFQVILPKADITGLQPL